MKLVLIWYLKKKKIVRKKKQFNKDVGDDANGSQSSDDNFRVIYFLHIIY